MIWHFLYFLERRVKVDLDEDTQAENVSPKDALTVVAAERVNIEKTVQEILPKSF